MTEDEMDEILKDFVEKIRQQEDLPDEYRKVLDEHFWELVDESN